MTGTIYIENDKYHLYRKMTSTIYIENDEVPFI